MGKLSRLIIAVVLLSGCGTGTSPSSITVTGITPATGTTLGGTKITIAGSRFAAGAEVTIGGAAATDVSVAGPTAITATTPQHPAGTVDVVVTAANGQRGTLPAAFTYVAPQPVMNTPPVISSIVVQGSVGSREPPQFASLDETVGVTATVTDAETPVSQLSFEWASDGGGMFTGDGARVSWTAPHALTTPATVVLTLRVTERYQTTDASGLVVSGTNRVTRTTSVRVHDSIGEIGDLAVDFLIGFSKQLDPAYVVRNFSDGCAGKADELSDVQKDNAQNRITSYYIGTPVTSIRFIGPGGCPFRGRFGDACAQVPVEWHSTNKATGAAGVVTGTDQVTAVLENDQWRLCGSDLNGAVPSALAGFRSHRRR